MTSEHFGRILRGLSDTFVKRPLWDFKPEYRNAVLRERRRRFGAPDDEVGDPQYS